MHLWWLINIVCMLKRLFSIYHPFFMELLLYSFNLLSIIAATWWLRRNATPAPWCNCLGCKRLSTGIAGAFCGISSDKHRNPNPLHTQDEGTPVTWPFYISNRQATDKKSIQCFIKEIVDRRSAGKKCNRTSDCQRYKCQQHSRWSF